MSETLEWYAKRGLLSAKDEEKRLNGERLSAGRKVVELYQSKNNSTGLVTRYREQVGGGQNLGSGSLNRLERQAEGAKELAVLLSIIPPRSKKCVEQVCLADELVGKPMMERLRCGLDAISHFYTKSKKMY